MGNSPGDFDNQFFGTKSDDRWRDIFPLAPLPESRAARDHAHAEPQPHRPSVGSIRNEATRRFNLTCANEAIEACNEMYAAGSDVNHNRSLTLAQRQAQNSFLRAVVKNPIPKPSMTKLRAAHELLHHPHSYSDCELVPTTVRSYRKADVSIPSVGNRIPHAIDVIDDIGRETLQDPKRTMLAAFNEVGS